MRGLFFEFEARAMELVGGGAQSFGRSASAVAEGAIPADHDMRGPDRCDDDLGDEFLGTLL